MNEVHKILYAHLGQEGGYLNLTDAQKLRRINRCREMMQNLPVVTERCIVTRHATGIRGELYANLIAFDKQWNLALSDVLEVWRRKAPDKRKIPPAMVGIPHFVLPVC
ncbi:hypothetical protein EVAR_99814_1 [Eumeta japonica]|uniref:U7 snRNA-associated Sm-like protein LSm11 n=1 Tax=Eumeta variegata TaxID=151549 RepID=A0A4C2AEA9_EUMVA|nr:hypothetical protein EVAR_99814_1 [Eumeta japonica]